MGLIGLGRHGMRYAQHLMGQIPNARLIAVCRRNAKEGQEFAQRHNLRFYQDYRVLLADPQVEAVLVVTAPSLTLPIAREAIRNKKPLLIEKPLAIHSADAREIVEGATKNHIPLMTAQTLRYDPTIQKLREIAPRVGKWRYLSLTCRVEHRDHSMKEMLAWENRGVLLEVGIHLLDLTRFLTGEEIQEVYCELDQPGEPDTPENRCWARLTTISGMHCSLDVSRVSSNRVTRAEIVGVEGQACADWNASRVYIATQQNQKEEYSLTPTPTLLCVLRDFFQALENRFPMPITGIDGLRAVEIANACYESAATGRPVVLS